MEGRQVKSKYGWCDEVWEEERGGGRSVPQLATEAVIATTHAEEVSMGRSKEKEGC